LKLLQISLPLPKFGFMQLETKSVLKKEISSVSKFAAAINSTPSAIYQAMANDKLDYVEIDGIKFVVMTKHTREYSPNKFK
jgi:hypothetical protein